MKTVCSFLSVSVILAIATSLFAADELPLRRVVIFNSGVGYFQRDGEVNGDATVELTFKVEQINDLLKSLVLHDPQGKVGVITYGSRDPVTRTLRSFSVDITDNPTLGNLLNRIRGSRVQVTAPREIEGIIVGVEKQQQQVKDQVMVIEVLNLLTADGLRAVPLQQVQQIKLLDPTLDGELRKALETLATSLDAQRKPVVLSFTGKGKRAVRVGYILETPVWKTSYRLSLDAKEKPFLQGWAVVENTTDEDWKNVSLALVSGRPISFIQDLYTPLYATRPIVRPELFTSLRPPTYDDSVESKPGDPRMDAQNAPAEMEADGRLMAKREMGARRGFAPAAPAPAFSNELLKSSGRLALADGGVSAMAQAAAVGELFQYAIDQPVTIARQKSAMIPIVNSAIEAEKVSIYNENVQRKFPLNGLRLKNTTNLHLMQGPITVFDGGVYAGDARIEDLQPKEERLISYAMDLSTEVEPLQKGGSSDMTAIKIVKGTLIITHKYVREKTYNVKSKTDEKRIVLIEHPFDASWELVSPAKTLERTPTVYRFRMEVDPRKTASLDVKEEQITGQQIALLNYDVGSIQVYLRSKVISAKAKEALERVVAMKMKLNDISRQRNEAQQEINNIAQEQSRIRENMSRLAQNSELYARYVKKFDEQETQIEGLRDRIKKLQEEENRQRKELEEYLANLQVE